ncbi:MAG: ABC transporter permease [Solirubrobacterales bacterium]|nr:ABC transporter permease [Solirubrobacterales bacterium]MCO5326881.1 ABC transporter permease [Solirubrobacterales bacterium]
MKWLLLKDLQIMRRSPLVTALLIVYPIVIAVLIGFALSRGPSEPRVAFVDELSSDTPVEIGGEQFDIDGAKDELCARVECVSVDTREEAEDLVQSGDVLGAIILPPDLLEKLQSLGGLNPETPTIEVLVNEEDPIKGGLVDDRISALLANANLRIAQQVSDASAQYLQVILDGGGIPFLGDSGQILGLRKSQKILENVRDDLPANDPKRKQLDQVISFAGLAIENLDLAPDLLSSVSQPIKVDKQIVNGGSPDLDSFAIAVAATVTLMFVTVLLVAGSLALEREENAFARLTRGLVGRTELLGEKVLLGVVVSLAVTILMLASITPFVSLEWGRLPIWIPAIAAGGASFAAFGAAIGAVTREVRAASLLAFMVSLPIAFLSLIPSGAIGATLYDVIDVFTALFPFDPALRAMGGALDASGPAVGVAIAHLLALAVGYAVIARVAIRRFA